MRKLVLALGLVVALAAAPNALAQDGDVAAKEDSSTASADAAGDTSVGDQAVTVQETEVDPSSFNMELRTLEEDVNTLKERVFRSKAILQLLKEIVVQGTSTGSRATVWHVNKLGPSYTLESVAYYLDGQGRFSQTDAGGDLDSSKEFKVYDGAVPPGNHTLTTTLKVRGNGMGFFNYVDDYTFTVQASTNFDAEEGQSCQVRVLIGQRKGIARSFTERVNVTFENQCVRLEEGIE